MLKGKREHTVSVQAGGDRGSAVALAAARSGTGSLEAPGGDSQRHCAAAASRWQYCSTAAFPEPFSQRRPDIPGRLIVKMLD